MPSRPIPAAAVPPSRRELLLKDLRASPIIPDSAQAARGRRWAEAAMTQREIVIQGAREHNLKGVDLRLPRGALITMTGVSGSGKSSLAFDTIYQEGQRRFVESLSSLRAPVPRPDREAQGRAHRGPVADDLDRPEDGEPEPALDGRHGHRDLRPPPAPLRAARRRRTALRAASRSRPQSPEQIVERLLARLAGPPARVPRPDREGPEGRVPEGARGAPDEGLRARAHRRRRPPPRRADRARALRAAHDRGRARPHRDRRPRSARASPRPSRTGSSSATGIVSVLDGEQLDDVLVALLVPGLRRRASPRWSRARSRSTARTARAPSATASASRTRSIPSSSSRDPRRRSTAARSRR